MVLHRTLEDAEIYFVSSRTHQVARADIAFRVTGRLPELWDADSGARKPLAFRMGEGHDDSARRVRPGRVGPDRIQTTDSGISAGREYACFDSDPATRHGLRS